MRWNLGCLLEEVCKVMRCIHKNISKTRISQVLKQLRRSIWIHTIAGTCLILTWHGTALRCHSWDRSCDTIHRTYQKWNLLRELIHFSRSASSDPRGPDKPASQFYLFSESGNERKILNLIEVTIRFRVGICTILLMKRQLRMEAIKRFPFAAISVAGKCPIKVSRKVSNGLRQMNW